MKKNLIIFLSGIAGMILQISLLDLFLSYFSRSSISNSLVISGWILGIALGAFYLSRHKPHKSWLSFIQVILGFVGMIIIGFPLFNTLDLIGIVAIKYISVIGLMTLIGILSGSVFIMITKKKPNKMPSFYGYDVSGGMIGGLLTGIILIPFIGITESIFIGSLLFILNGVLAYE